MMRDIVRLADKYGVGYRRPSQFPRLSVLSARVALLGQDQPWGRDFCRAVFRANFVDDLDIQDEAVVADILDRLALDGPALIAQARHESTKEEIGRAHV